MICIIPFKTIILINFASNDPLLFEILISTNRDKSISFINVLVILKDEPNIFFTQTTTATKRFRKLLPHKCPNAEMTYFLRIKLHLCLLQSKQSEENKFQKDYN